MICWAKFWKIFLNLIYFWVGKLPCIFVGSPGKIGQILHIWGTLRFKQIKRLQKPGISTVNIDKFQQLGYHLAHFSGPIVDYGHLSLTYKPLQKSLRDYELFKTIMSLFIDSTNILLGVNLGKRRPFHQAPHNKYDLWRS